MPDTPLNIAYRQHDRRWQENLYCYAVVSRRSGGLSIGVNLNPDKACNFDCIYCQVDRKTPPVTRDVDLAAVRAELDQLIRAAVDGSIFKEPPYDRVPPANRVIRDIAFSGDGEPTTYPRFKDAVQIAAELRSAHALTDTQLVLITDACYLSRLAVREALAILDANNGHIWAKLDAGTEEYYRLVNRPNYPLSHVLANILDAARVRPVTIQSLFMRVHGAPPPHEEIEAYCARLNDLITAGGQIEMIQLYTIARETTEPYATMLTDAELDGVVQIVRARVPVPVTPYYGVVA
ncbi:Radical SAM superfamily protein [Phycisphaerae bacterium RAS2]|nr:Radical SAM superfamily protein [Phycisphaerae bacterium RAS2]